jgi:hypothetical protein
MLPEPLHDVGGLDVAVSVPGRMYHLQGPQYVIQQLHTYISCHIVEQTVPFAIRVLALFLPLSL